MTDQQQALVLRLLRERDEATARAEQAEAAFNRLLDDKDAMEGKLMAERDETKGLFEGAMWQVRLHWEEVQKAEARAEQAEAALREIAEAEGLDPNHRAAELRSIARAALAATTPGESRTERETVTFYVHGTAEAVYEYENAEVPE